MNRDRMPRALGWSALGITAALGIVFVALPLIAVARRAGSGASALVDPQILSIVRMSLVQATLSTVIASSIGVPLGLKLAAARGKLAAIGAWLLEIPFGVPTVVAATSWVILLGRSGFAGTYFGDPGWLYSLKAVILAHVAYNVPWIALLVSRASREVPPRLIEMAQTLGASRGERLRWVVWPEIRWAFYSAAIQAFSYCVMSFALVLLLGGGPPVETLETALYSHVRAGALDLSGAAACAIWELAVTLVPWSLVLGFRARDERRQPLPGPVLRGDGEEDPRKRRRGRGRGWGVAAFSALFVLPYFAVLPGIQPLSGEAAQSAWDALGVSLQLGFGCAFLAVLAGVIAMLATASAGQRWGADMRAAVSAVLMIPSGVSALVLALGLWLTYQQWVDPFAGSLGAMMVLQATLFFPMVYRMLWPLAQRMPLGLIDAARGLGASSLRAFWIVDGRRWLWPLMSAFTLVLAASLGEVAAVSFFYSEDLIPLPLLVSRWMGQYRFEEARFVAASLFCLSAGAVSLVFVLRNAGSTEGGFHEFR